MKKLFLLFIIWNIALFTGFGQSIKEKETKGLYHTLIVKTYANGSISIYNKTDSLRFIDPNISCESPMPILSDQKVLDRLTKKYITTTLKRMSINPIDKNGVPRTISVELIADMSGKIKETSFSYPEYWNIPITVIEKYMIAILNANLTYSYDRENYCLKNAKWIGSGVTYSYQKLMEL